MPPPQNNTYIIVNNSLNVATLLHQMSLVQNYHLEVKKMHIIFFEVLNKKTRPNRPKMRLVLVYMVFLYTVLAHMVFFHMVLQYRVLLYMVLLYMVLLCTVSLYMVLLYLVLL